MTVLLSFDIEEFDMPFEYGRALGMDEQLSISQNGTITILEILERHDIKATFFSTVVFAKNSPDIMEMIVQAGHEIGSHSYYHSDFRPEHLAESRYALQQLTRQPVLGFRMPRMQPVSSVALVDAGYGYSSSLNPTYLPGRYNNFDKPRTIFHSEGIIHVPASVTPGLRLPLFWLALHNLPLGAYDFLCRFTLWRDTYLNLYFHPWEFTDISDARFGLPKYVHRNSGKKMIERFESLVERIKKRGAEFKTIGTFLESQRWT